jgi:20S proteasome alpha/beta subunit
MRAISLPLAPLIWVFSVTISAEFFDSSGRLTQVEYANKASMKGGTVIGICSDEAAVLLTWSSWSDKSVKLPCKIHQITDFTAVSSSGIVSDVNYLTQKIFEEATEHSFVFGSDPPASRMALSLADYVHDRSISARYRPLGIRMCIASYDDISNASITEIDAIGNLHRCKLSCIGKFRYRLT